LKGNPKLWYYLGLSVMRMNKEIEQTINKDRESDTYRAKYDFKAPNFEKESGICQLKRFQLAPQGDSIIELHRLVAEKENDYLQKLSRSQADFVKNMQK